jgi:hypothetical protein
VLLRLCALRGEVVRSKKNLLARYLEASGKHANIGRLNAALRELEAAGLVDGLSLTQLRRPR